MTKMFRCLGLGTLLAVAGFSTGCAAIDEQDDIDSEIVTDELALSAAEAGDCAVDPNCAMKCGQVDFYRTDSAPHGEFQGVMGDRGPGPRYADRLGVNTLPTEKATAQFCLGTSATALETAQFNFMRSLRQADPSARETGKLIGNYWTTGIGSGGLWRWAWAANTAAVRNLVAANENVDGVWSIIDARRCKNNSTGAIRETSGNCLWTEATLALRISFDPAGCSGQCAATWCGQGATGYNYTTQVCTFGS